MQKSTQQKQIPKPGHHAGHHVAGTASRPTLFASRRGQHFANGEKERVQQK